MGNPSGEPRVQRVTLRFTQKEYDQLRMQMENVAEATSVDKFLLALSSIAGDKMQDKESTLVFIDEIQAYDHLLTLAKFLMEDGRFNYIASGSLLGVTLKKTQSIPIVSISILHMYPLDFEEFLWANNVGELAIEQMKSQFEARLPLSEAQHSLIMDMFRKYLLVGGLPDAVNTYVSEHNIMKIRSVQRDIQTLYGDDAVKYEKEASRKLKIKRIYDMVPSNIGMSGQYFYHLRVSRLSINKSIHFILCRFAFSSLPLLRSVASFLDKTPKTGSKFRRHLFYNDNHIDVMCRPRLHSSSGHRNLTRSSSNYHVIIGELCKCLLKFS